MIVVNFVVVRFKEPVEIGYFGLTQLCWSIYVVIHGFTHIVKATFVKYCTFGGHKIPYQFLVLFGHCLTFFLPLFLVVHLSRSFLCYTEIKDALVVLDKLYGILSTYEVCLKS